jgi:hypothetical protein
LAKGIQRHKKHHGATSQFAEELHFGCALYQGMSLLVPQAALIDSGL